jgi:hypothetical protein
VKVDARWQLHDSNSKIKIQHQLRQYIRLQETKHIKSEIKALTVSNTRLKSAACLTNLHTSSTGASAARN